jgi:hypothetical protein
MNIGSFFKKTFSRASVYFTLITAIYALIVMIVNVDDKLVLLDAGRVLLFFVASFLFSLGNAFLAVKKFAGPLRVFLHYLVYLFAFCACFLLPISLDTSGTIVGVTLFTIIYAISLAIVLLVRSRYKTRTELQNDYSPQFKK